VHSPPEPITEPAQAGTLWRHRNFLLLWAGQSVSEMGSAVTQLALPLTAVVILGASTFQVGLLTSAATAAFALIALPAGALVDRWAKRRLMIWCDVARMLIIGSVPVAAALHLLTMGQLYAVAVTAGVGTVFFDVAYQSYLPVLVAREHLVDGNGKLGATQSFAQVAGPGLGGGLVGLVGPARAMGADAISYAISVASLLFIRDRENPPPADGDRAGLRAEIAEGLSFVLRHPVLRKIAACTGTANLFGSMGVALEIIFLIRVLRIRPADTGLLIAVASLGGVAGGVFAGRLSRRIGPHHLVLDARARLPPAAHPAGRVRLADRRLPRRHGLLLLLRRGLQRGAGQLPAGDLPAPAARPDERRDPLGGLGHDPPRRTARRRARHSGRGASHAVDRLRRQLGVRLVGVLLPAPPPARARRQELVPHQSMLARTFRTSRPGRPAALLLSRASPPGRPGLTATMPHRDGQDRYDVTS
jgi:MFS family permease